MTDNDITSSVLVLHTVTMMTRNTQLNIRLKGTSKISQNELLDCVLDDYVVDSQLPITKLLYI